jgi:hypothetical protein
MHLAACAAIGGSWGDREPQGSGDLKSQIGVTAAGGDRSSPGAPGHHFNRGFRMTGTDPGTATPTAGLPSLSLRSSRFCLPAPE